jgi:mRNA interferase RelE/StbE
LSYNITFKESVWRDLKRIDKHQIEIFLAKIEAILPEGAESYPTLSGQFSKLRKFRVGNYRVIYTIKDNSVLITRIQHRKDVYRS